MSKSDKASDDLVEHRGKYTLIEVTELASLRAQLAAAEAELDKQARLIDMAYNKPCARCGSSKDTFIVCAGCQSPVALEAQLASVTKALEDIAHSALAARAIGDTFIMRRALETIEEVCHGQLGFLKPDGGENG